MPTRVVLFSWVVSKVIFLPLSTPFLLLVSRIDSVHARLIIGIATAHARYVADAGVILIEAKLASGTGIVAAVATDVTGVITRSRYLIPLESLKSWILS